MNSIEEVTKRYEELVKLKGDSALETLECKIELATAYAYHGNGSEAFALIKEAYEKYLELFGKEHDRTMAVYGMVGNMAAALGMKDIALTAFETVSNYWVSHYGEEDVRSVMASKQYIDYKKYYLE
ncbi:MAG: tetratricopeptide repeat protein [Erysipelotrichales bacterium]|nr:tetratricopeptide repeat protein [Erysipelotrichales bacterium]